MRSEPVTAPNPVQGRSTGSERSAWRRVALPSEHGGWSLTAEPALLGLLVAWSLPGLALGVAAMVAFVARTPIKLVLVDRWRHRWLARTALAARIAAVELVVFGSLVVYAAVAAEPGFWVPLAAAMPLIGLELWYDMRSRSRRLIPELAGSIGIGSVATAIALAEGAPDRMAWGLWVVIAIRSLAAIPYVRTQISRAKSRPHPLWQSDLAQLIAAAAAVSASIADIVPVATAVVITLATAANIVAVRLRPRRAVLIGIEQTFHGVAIIATTAIAILIK
jgi:hypothetical protein